MSPLSFILAIALLAPAPTRAADPAVYLVVRNSPLAGFRYNEGKQVWSDMRAGDLLAMVREADNPFDANAIRVEWNGRKIGYVPRRENHDLARQIDSGTRFEALITGLAKSRNGRYLISYDILVPLRASPDMRATTQ